MGRHFKRLGSLLLRMGLSLLIVMLAWLAYQSYQKNNLQQALQQLHSLLPEQRYAQHAHVIYRWQDHTGKWHYADQPPQREEILKRTQFYIDEYNRIELQRQALYSPQQQQDLVPSAIPTEKDWTPVDLNLKNLIEEVKQINLRLQNRQQQIEALTQ